MQQQTFFASLGKAAQSQQSQYRQRDIHPGIGLLDIGERVESDIAEDVAPTPTKVISDIDIAIVGKFIVEMSLVKGRAAGQQLAEQILIAPEPGRHNYGDG